MGCHFLLQGFCCNNTIILGFRETERKLDGEERGMERKASAAAAAAAAAKSLQLCPTRCDPIDGSPPGSPVPGTLQARTLEWVAISFSSA